MIGDVMEKWLGKLRKRVHGVSPRVGIDSDSEEGPAAKLSRSTLRPYYY